MLLYLSPLCKDGVLTYALFVLGVRFVFFADNTYKLGKCFFNILFLKYFYLKLNSFQLPILSKFLKKVI